MWSKKEKENRHHRKKRNVWTEWNGIEWLLLCSCSYMLRANACTFYIQRNKVYIRMSNNIFFLIKQLIWCGFFIFFYFSWNTKRKRGKKKRNKQGWQQVVEYLDKNVQRCEKYLNWVTQRHRTEMNGILYI